MTEVETIERFRAKAVGLGFEDVTYPRSAEAIEASRVAATETIEALNERRAELQERLAVAERRTSVSNGAAAIDLREIGNTISEADHKRWLALRTQALADEAALRTERARVLTAIRSMHGRLAALDAEDRTRQRQDQRAAQQTSELDEMVSGATAAPVHGGYVNRMLTNLGLRDRPAQNGLPSAAEIKRREDEVRDRRARRDAKAAEIEANLSSRAGIWP